MSFRGTDIVHLEKDDFVNNVLVYNGKPVKGTWIVMVQGSYCGHCQNMKPAFAKVAKKFGNMNLSKVPVFATIKIDGNDNERALSQMLPKITKMQLSGVPALLKFEDGKFAAMVVGGRNEGQLIEFMQKQ